MLPFLEAYNPLNGKIGPGRKVPQSARLSVCECEGGGMQPLFGNAQIVVTTFKR